MNDEPLPLAHLRTPVPLNEFDYAAVRARVRSELARRKERNTWMLVFRFAAAMLLIVLALNVKENKPVERQALSLPAETRPEARRAESPPLHRLVAVAKPHHRKKPQRHEPEVTAVSRIEIHTDDPDIRIIWIVPKENS